MENDDNDDAGPIAHELQIGPLGEGQRKHFEQKHTEYEERLMRGPRAIVNHMANKMHKALEEAYKAGGKEQTESEAVKFFAILAHEDLQKILKPAVQDVLDALCKKTIAGLLLDKKRETEKSDLTFKEATLACQKAWMELGKTMSVAFQEEFLDAFANAWTVLSDYQKTGGGRVRGGGGFGDQIGEQETEEKNVQTPEQIITSATGFEDLRKKLGKLGKLRGTPHGKEPPREYDAHDLARKMGSIEKMSADDWKSIPDKIHFLRTAAGITAANGLAATVARLMDEKMNK